jgi:hypothetical protein
MLYYYGRNKTELFAAETEANKEANTERDYVLARGPPPLEKFLLLLPIEDFGP